MTRSITLFVISLLPCLGLAQDPSFSQFYANRIYLNPATTGLESGISLAGVSRMQWTKVDDGFKTYGLTVEIQEPFIKSGFGLSLFKDEQGLAQLTTKSIGISYAYTIPFHTQNIHIGIQGLWVQKSVDYSRLIFSDQLDPVFGVVHGTSYNSILDRIHFTDFNIGILWRGVSDLKIGRRVFRDTRSSLGLSLAHAPYVSSLAQGNESFQHLNTRTAPRLTIHAGSIMPALIFKGVGHKIQLSPNIKFDMQGEELSKIKQNLKVLTYGLYLLYEGVYFGTFYQNKHPGADLKNTNALIFALGAYIRAGHQRRSDKQKFFVGFSYDANATGLGTRAGSVIEVAFRWTFAEGPTIFGDHRGRGSGKVLDCFSFF